ncbi:MAG: AzlC family ABC transporter permease [Anaerolineales bacterium]
MANRPITQHPTSTADLLRAFASGVKAELPIAIGVIPFGMIYGVLAVAAGIPPLVAQAMSSIVFAGSAQFITVQLIVSGAVPGVIVLTAAIVNLRHALYSASMAPYLQPLHPLWKWLLAYLLTDEAYAVAITHYQDQRPSINKHWYFLGAGLTLWATWQSSSGVGIFLGAQVPESWSLDFTLALTFIGLVVPTLKQRSSTAAALLAGVTAVLLVSLPFKLGLIMAAMVGITIGMLVEVRGWNSGSS